MSNETEQVEKVDHGRLAEGLLLKVGGNTTVIQAEAFHAAAQVHASLAIAEQLERLNEQLAEVIEPGRSDPGGRGHLLGLLRSADPDA